MFAFWSSPNHIPIKYWGPIKKTSHLGPIYLRPCTSFPTSFYVWVRFFLGKSFLLLCVSLGYGVSFCHGSLLGLLWLPSMPKEEKGRRRRRSMMVMVFTLLHPLLCRRIFPGIFLIHFLDSPFHWSRWNQLAFCLKSCSVNGRLLSIIGRDPSVCKSNWLHVYILRFSFIKFGYIL